MEHAGWTVAIVASCAAIITVVISEKRRRTAQPAEIAGLITAHFAPIPPAELIVSESKFPLHVRADIHQAFDLLFADARVRRFTGVRREYDFMGIDFASLTDTLTTPAIATAPQYEALDIGEETPVRCLKKAESSAWNPSCPRATNA
jgi:hypothetical protein